MNLEEKYSSLKQILKSLGKVVIAYSGGVDSTFLLRVAVDALGAENVLACIDTGPSLAQSQYEQAKASAEAIDVRLITVRSNELADRRYAVNEADRCFHCKSNLYKVLVELAKKKDFDVVLSGANFDDKDDFRPGHRAAEVFDIRAPLMEAELTKQDIRTLSRRLNLPTAEVPASPCLASRIAYGLEITAERLKQVEQAEEFLRSLGFVEFRVRHHEAIARIEVKPGQLEKLITEPLRSKVVEKLKSLGFKYVSVDLQGFRSGSLNEALPEIEKQKDWRFRCQKPS